MGVDTLIAELERATEGSRDLDARIYCMLNERIVHSRLPIGYTMKDLGNKHRNMGLAVSQFIHSDRGPSPHYTTSLDAALTLVQEGWGWDVMHDSVAAVRPPDSEGDDELAYWGLAPHGTPALALCIAALRTRQAMEEGG